MVASPIITTFELLGLWIGLLPLGGLLIRIGERLLRTSFSLTVPERLLLAPYVAGSLLFVVASAPVPVYGTPLVVLLLATGAVGQLVIWVRERGRTLGPVVSWVRTPAALFLGVGTVALAVLEISSLSTHSFPNAYDGSYHTLYVHLLVSNHTLPWTLEPYAASGVIYPLAPTVWLSLPILLFGWSTPSAPVFVPSFFLALSIVGAYCWGYRIGGADQRRADTYGLLFAGFFGLVASWPRLFVGGSYDFAIAFPLLLVTFGWLQPFVERIAARPAQWRSAVAMGMFLGLVTSLSLAAGEALVLFLVAMACAFCPQKEFARFVTYLLTVIGCIALWTLRSLVGIAIWFRYPSHVLSAMGNPPTVTTPGLPSPTGRAFVSDLDPFSLDKFLLSPIPLFSLEIVVLLVVGLALAIILAFSRSGGTTSSLRYRFLRPVLVGAFAQLLWTFVLIAGSGTKLASSTIDVFASLYESTFVLYVFYQTIALVPLLLAAEYLLTCTGRGSSRGNEERETIRPPGWHLPGRSSRPSFGGVQLIAAALLVAVPLGVGVAGTTAYVPPYLSDHLGLFANVSAADVAALEWAGDHLPPCSVVLVAPGSAAQFLPLYADVHVDFPMMPLSVNFSYNVAVNNLTSGGYSAVTRTALTNLGITEVFVTGVTSVSYPPFLMSAFLGNTDFNPLYRNSDAAIFAFVAPGGASSCAI